MYRAINNNIYITRGDTGIFDVPITDKDDKVFTPSVDDTIVLTVKTSTSATVIIMQKTVVDGTVTILPKDTSALAYGEYVYDVQLTRADGYVDTIITPHKFTVCEEVTQ